MQNCTKQIEIDIEEQIKNNENLKLKLANAT